METILYKANTRGHANYGWLNTHYSFSFANYYNPERIHFGNLRVLNDDIIQAGTGFDTHPHDNMEIVTVPLYGELTHTDSMGHKQVIGANEVQVMSAGTGIFHSEVNEGKVDASILQIWIFPKLKNIKPRYDQIMFQPEEAKNNWQFLVNGGTSPLTINQDARVSRVWLDAGTELEYTLQKGAFGSFLFLIEGETEVGGEILHPRDAIGVSNSESFTVKAVKPSYLLNIEI
jgi:quercetin 2,3-dioxygenase